jgi:hypothetical protein
VAEQGFDLIILDLMLPDISGNDVCRQIRASSAVPILMLTAKDTEVDRVLGLEVGADDYVGKPFSMAELIGRIRAILRRRQLDLEEAGSRRLGRHLRPSPEDPSHNASSLGMGAPRVSLGPLPAAGGVSRCVIGIEAGLGASALQAAPWGWSRSSSSSRWLPTAGWWESDATAPVKEGASDAGNDSMSDSSTTSGSAGVCGGSCESRCFVMASSERSIP